MKSIRLHLAACIAGASIILFTSASAAVIVGTGTSSSFLVLEAPEFGAPLEFEYRYTFNAGAPPDTYAMLTAVDLSQANLSFAFSNFGSSESPNYFLTNITFNAISLTNTGAPDFAPFWYQSVSGGEAGFPTSSPVAGGTWSEGSGISSPYRKLAPGSWDGFVYGDFGDTPSTSPVPEPSIFALLGVGFLVALVRCRPRRA